jgi:glycosyltransferase involved in cell wall biosynthesis
MQRRTTLSVCLITRNEEANLQRCLDSVRDLATEIVVVDSLSDDRTCEIAAAANARVWHQPFLGYEKQKNLALAKTTGDWVLCLDADEWLDRALHREVERIVDGEAEPGVDGYRVNRWPFYLGAWIDHSGWSPDWKVRLVRAGTGTWTGGDPHERLEVGGPTRKLRGRLYHYPYKDLATQLVKINRYTDMLVARGPARTARILYGLLLEPPLVFLQKFILQAGFRDGMRGFIAACTTSFYFFLKFAKHWESRHGRAHPSSRDD